MGQHGVQKPEKLIVCCVSACYLSTDINAIPHYRFTAVASYPVWQGASLTGDKYLYSKRKIPCLKSLAQSSNYAGILYK